MSIELNKESVEQAGGDRRDALQSIMEWTAAENIPDDRKLCLIRNAARAALAQPSPKCATCNDSGQIVVSGPHYQGEFQPPEYETEPCDMCAQPSPAQAEQAEAERPEVVATMYTHHDDVDFREFVVVGNCDKGCEGFYGPEKLMTVAQHDRIVGALRAENAQLSEDLNRLSIIRSRLNLRLDFALDKISKLESRWPHGESPEERFEHYISNTIDRAPEPLRRLGNWLSHVLDEDQWTTAERMLTGACVAAEERAAAQTQHSVPEGWKPVPIEPLLNMMSDKDHDTRIMAERQLLSILAAAPDKEVGHE
ncbi:TPA: hypothetical protein N2B33_005746 [Pseudomonas aeruginosa]|nr:hypothetical protein [Pseudomonas aeruginosa]